LSLPLSEKDIDAFVLAGGQSSRMGQDKALIQLAGVPLIQHALGILRAAGLNARIAGAGAGLSSYAPVIADDPQYAGLGPLAGVCSALSATNSRFCLFLPIDLPLIPSSLITFLLHHAIITEAVVTVVSVAGFTQTFPAVIDRAAAPHLRASLESNNRKTITAFKTAASALGRPFAALPSEILVQPGQVFHAPGVPVSSWFLNVNTPEDLGRAGALLATANQVS
jgi:molybdenum cofactor guanylyltransferase